MKNNYQILRSFQIKLSEDINLQKKLKVTNYFYLYYIPISAKKINPVC